jgi:hypothetical protein
MECVNVLEWRNPSFYISGPYDHKSIHVCATFNSLFMTVVKSILLVIQKHGLFISNTNFNSVTHGSSKLYNSSSENVVRPASLYLLS